MDTPDSPIRRPIGMTILLILSTVVACSQIFSNIGTYLTLPQMNKMLADGTLEEGMGPLLSLMRMGEEDTKLFWETLQTRLSINPLYYLFTALLNIGALVGVIKMFKLQRTGFHIFSISKILLLMVTVVYAYSKEGYGAFFNELLFTAMIILLYHLYLKRIEFMRLQASQKREDDGQTQGE